jgi:DNA-binding Xre family transcriptional regulator
MSQINLLISCLKQQLKQQGKTYADVAEYLELSEANVKRMFAQQLLTLERMDAICAFLGIEISDLLQTMQQMSQRITQLSLEQEQMIVSDRKLCLIAICVINQWSLTDILQYYNLTELECIRYLATLDKLKIIELLPKNKFKLLISRRFNWIPNGPLQQFFQRYILADFTRSSFKHEQEKMVCEFGMLSKTSIDLFIKKLNHLAQEFLEMNQQDLSEPIQQKQGTACVLMVRPWAPSIFDEFIRSNINQ